MSTILGEDYFADYRKAGVNRLSLGIQSFDNEKLQTLGRIHDGEEAIKAVKIARDVGFESLNLDLMFGLPEQSIDAGLADLQQAIDLYPLHISWYQLTLEPNTIFYKKPPRLPDEDRIFELHQIGKDLLATNGFQQYEISAYTQANQECQHNINYWQFGDYLGIGAGAHGKISLDIDRIVRTRKVKQPNSYLQRRHALAAETILTTNDRAFEYMLNALRLTQPVNLSDFSKKTGLTIDSIKIPLQTATEKKLILVKDKLVQKTELGQHFLNDLLALFL